MCGARSWSNSTVRPLAPRAIRGTRAFVAGFPQFSTFARETFIADPAVPVAERQHRIDFWVANTDPR